MSRLPIPGGDDNAWGDVLNDFLRVAHNDDASLKSAAVQKALPSATDGQALVYDIVSKTWQPGTIDTTVITDASTTNKGVVRLAGDLSGTADLPTVPGLADKYVKPPTGIPASDLDQSVQDKLNAAADESNLVHKTGTETITGAKDFTGGLSLYGIGVVQTDDIRLADERVPTDDSVTDAKVSATANISQTKIAGLTSALANKISVSEKGAPNGVATLDANGKLPGTQIEPQPEATAVTLGTIQLAGDIGGTATAPTIAKLQGYDVSDLAPAEGQALTYVGGFWEAKDIEPAGYVRGDGIAKVTVGPTAPISPAVGDVWVDTT